MAGLPGDWDRGGGNEAPKILFGGSPLDQITGLFILIYNQHVEEEELAWERDHHITYIQI